MHAGDILLFHFNSIQSLTYFLQSLLPLTALIFVGHVSKHKSKLLIDATCEFNIIIVFIYYFLITALGILVSHH